MILLNVEREDSKLVPRHEYVEYKKEIKNPYRKPGEYNQGCWRITNDFSGDLYKYNSWLVPTETTLTNLCKSLSDNVKVDRHAYTFQADVNKVFNREDNTFCMLTLLTEHNTNRVIKAKVFREILGDMDCNDLLEKEVKVTGALYLFAPYNELQFEVTEIHVLGPCSRLVEYEQWKAENADILENKTVPPTFDKLIEKVGLITNKNTEGYKDFVNKLDKRIPAENIFLKDVKLRVDSMIKAIEDLNEENGCDVICIVRGGGNPESLVDFSRPELLKAIHASKIPVITGIGHVSYKLLCNEAAFWHTDTPTAAATFINRSRADFFTNKKSVEREKTVKVINKQTTKHLKDIASLNQELSALNEKYKKAGEQIAALEKDKESLLKEKKTLHEENDGLKAQIAELKKQVESNSPTNELVKEKKGFFSKFFG